MRYILHYTKPGDIVFDGFCGTGMTGVAAQMCGNSLVFKSLQDVKGDFGVRYSVLNDLSPIASFIAENFNTTVNAKELYYEGQKVIEDVAKEIGWVYETAADQSNGIFDNYEIVQNGIINYTIWSDVFICPHCGKELIFGSLAVDFKDRKSVV